MKNIIIVTCIFLLLSCSKKTSTDQNSSPVLSGLSDSSFEESPIHPDLLKAWNEYRREYEPDGIIDTAIYYFMGFYSYKTDSLFIIFLNYCNGKYTGYKGMSNIDGYYVAVLDPENIGKDFYNSKLLIQKDTSDFKCIKYEGKYIGSVTSLGFKVKNNRIEFRKREGNSDGDIPF